MDDLGNYPANRKRDTEQKEALQGRTDRTRPFDEIDPRSPLRGTAKHEFGRNDRSPRRRLQQNGEDRTGGCDPAESPG